MFKDGLRRAQSTDSLGTSGSLQSKALGYNNKAKSAGNLDESDFGPLVGADSVSENFDTASLGSLQMPSGFMLTKDQEKAIKAMTPEQEETASLLSSVTQGVESAYVSPSGYRLVSETEWNLLQKEVRTQGLHLRQVAGLFFMKALPNLGLFQPKCPYDCMVICFTRSQVQKEIHSIVCSSSLFTLGTRL